MLLVQIYSFLKVFIVYKNTIFNSLIQLIYSWHMLIAHAQALIVKPNPSATS